MQGKATQSLARKCIACGTEKPLNSDYFQPIQSFRKGYSFYCNICDAESRKQKSFAQPLAAVNLAKGDHSLDRDANSPA